MALPFYVKITGEKSGVIEGSNHKVGRENLIQGHALEQRYHRAYNHETGSIQGQAIKGPFKITKSFDKSSPLLYQACADGEHLEVVMEFERVDGETGDEVVYFTITLGHAVIVEIRPHMSNHLDEKLAVFDHQEDVLITFRDIEWRDVVSGVSAEDKRGN